MTVTSASVIMYFFSRMLARDGEEVAWRYSTSGKGSHLAGHLPEKKKRSSDPLHLMRAAHARTRAMIKMRSFSAITPCMPQCVHTYITLTPLDRASYNVQHVRGRLGGVSERQKGAYIYASKQASIPYLGNVHIQYCTHTHKQDTQTPTHPHHPQQ